jgi:hypothetical protein
VVREAVAQYGEAAVESWARAKGIPTGKSKKPGDVSSSSGDRRSAIFPHLVEAVKDARLPPVEAMARAVPDQVAVLDFVRSPMGRHDFHIVAIRRIRCDRIWGLLSPAA